MVFVFSHSLINIHQRPKTKTKRAGAFAPMRAPFNQNQKYFLLRGTICKIDKLVLT